MNETDIGVALHALLSSAITERDSDRQDKKWMATASFCMQTSPLVEELSEDSPLVAIHEACLPLEHFGDDTGFCPLNEEDVKSFINQLEKYYL